MKNLLHFSWNRGHELNVAFLGISFPKNPLDRCHSFNFASLNKNKRQFYETHAEIFQVTSCWLRPGPVEHLSMGELRIFSAFTYWSLRMFSRLRIFSAPLFSYILLKILKSIMTVGSGPTGDLKAALRWQLHQLQFVDPLLII
jgi:hypothetical protein